MDNLDTKILRELVQDRSAFVTSDVKKSFRAVARKLHVNELTVRNRVAGMQRSGFLQGWTVMPNPSLMGLKPTQLLIEVPHGSSKAELIEQLKLLPSSLVVVDCFGDSLYYVFFYRDEGSLRSQVELVQKMSRATELIHSPIPVPECEIKLTMTDLEILRSLRRNARKPFSWVASELGLSTRTVKRRLQRMVDARAVFALPSMNPGALEGVFQADLMVTFSEIRSKIQFDKRFRVLWDEYLMRAETGTPASSFFNLFLKSIIQAQEVLDWAREQAGVANARLELVHNRYELDVPLNSELDRTIQRLTALSNKAVHGSGGH